MFLIGIINLLTGAYLIQDTLERMERALQILYFDNNLYGFAKYIPLIIGIMMIIAGLGILIFQRQDYIFLSYVSSFIFILFFTPTAFFIGNSRDDIRFLLSVQLTLLIISIIILYTTHEKNKRGKYKVRITYEDYKRSLERIKEYTDSKEEKE